MSKRGMPEVMSDAQTFRLKMQEQEKLHATEIK